MARAKLELSMKTVIDTIVGSFAPVMKKIQETNESDDRKTRHAEAWLESKLKDVAASIFHDILRAPVIAVDTSRVGAEAELGWEKRGPAVRECLIKIATDYGIDVSKSAEKMVSG